MIEYRLEVFGRREFCIFLTLDILKDGPLDQGNTMTRAMIRAAERHVWVLQTRRKTDSQGVRAAGIFFGKIRGRDDSRRDLDAVTHESRDCLGSSSAAGRRARGTHLQLERRL